MLNPMQKKTPQHSDIQHTHDINFFSSFVFVLFSKQICAARHNVWSKMTEPKTKKENLTTANNRWRCIYVENKWYTRSNVTIFAYIRREGRKKKSILTHARCVLFHGFFDFRILFYYYYFFLCHFFLFLFPSLVSS